MREPGRTAIGTWSGGRFLHFGETIDEERLEALLRPGGGIDTVLTADTYGQGEADSLLGRALAGSRARTTAWSAPSATTSTRASATGRGASRASPTRGCAARMTYASYLRMAAERSLERLGASSLRPAAAPQPRPHRLHERGGLGRDGGPARGGPDAAIGVAPGPANGFTLDLISCLERFGDRIDWAMIILNPFEPWPGELCLDAAAEQRRPGDHPRRRLRRPLLGRHTAGHGARRRRPPRLPPRRLDRGRAREARAGPADRRTGAADADPARLPVEPRPPRGRVRRPDPDPGGARRGLPDRGQAGRTGGAPRRAAALATRTSPRSARSATTPAAWR